MSSITPELELPVLSVDKAHWQTQTLSGEEPLEYTINNCKGFILSTEGFEFAIPEGSDFTSPNIIQVILGKDQLYAMAYEPSVSLYTIKAANLVPLYGSVPFKGFDPGQKFIIAVGHLAPRDKEMKQPKFTILWAGVVNVNQ